ncbi:MAG: hypothetical protein AB1813_21675, partial [Verrucomicrobiota bacterium]
MALPNELGWIDYRLFAMDAPANLDSIHARFQSRRWLRRFLFAGAGGVLLAVFWLAWNREPRAYGHALSHWMEQYA